MNTDQTRYLDQSLWTYCGCDWFYERYQPLSPYGQRLRGQRDFFTDVRELLFEHRLIELFLVRLRDAELSPGIDMIKGAFSRLTSLAESFGASMDADEIFIVKRFLHNAQLIDRHLHHEISELFSFAAFPHGLLAELGRGQTPGESFFVADVYDPRLLALRRNLDKLAGELNEKRTKRLEAITAATAIDFAAREFVVVDAARFAELSQHAAWVTIENHDGAHILVRPRPGADEIALEHEAWSLRAAEQAIEREVCAALGQKIAAGADVLCQLQGILGRLDAALAKASMAEKFGLVRPSIADDLAVAGGRFLPLEEACRQSGSPYTPLDMTLGGLSAVIYGSNMGGKSVVLKTIGFLQVLTQLGFYLPVDAFATRLYDGLFFIGSRALGGDDGLSGFGAELFAFQERWQGKPVQSLFLIDEFASTTNAREATALSHALIATLSEEKGVHFLMATHFLKDGPLHHAVRIMRMQGIDRKRLKALGEQTTDGLSSGRRVQLLNQCMTYKMVEQDEIKMVREALRVAAFLGLDQKMLARAESLMEGVDASQQT